MAMRLYDREEFEADIKRRWKLEKTGVSVGTAALWKTPSGKTLWVPVLDQYADFWLDRVRQQISDIESREVPWR